MNLPAKMDNSAREREASMSQRSTPHSHRAHTHTPHTYPRTKQTAHMKALQSLRQTLVFNDEVS